MEALSPVTTISQYQQIRYSRASTWQFTVDRQCIGSRNLPKSKKKKNDGKKDSHGGLMINQKCMEAVTREDKSCILFHSTIPM